MAIANEALMRLCSGVDKGPHPGDGFKETGE